MERSSDQVIKSSNFMAGKDLHKLFHTLLNQYITEKSQGDLRVVLRKKIDELESELEAANADLDKAKHDKETTEQEIKGYEVESSLNGTSIQTLEARVSVLQGEIAIVRAELASLRWDEGIARDEFLSHMLELNIKLREYQDKLARNKGDESVENATEDSPPSTEEMLFKVITQLTNEEREYQVIKDIQNQSRQVLGNLQKKFAAVLSMDEARKDLKDTTKLASVMEETFERLSEELRKSCFCPKCSKDNMEALDSTLQVNDEGN